MNMQSFPHDQAPANGSPGAADTPGARVWTVSELNRLVKDLLEQSLMPFWLEGEISNLTIHRSGHVYLSLKDDRSQVPAVFFRGAETARQLGLQNGLEVEVWGRLSVYEPRGAYQVLITRIRGKGLGRLQQAFETLKQQLRNEGLFDQDRKRPLPLLPRCVGVVTSPDGAALRDFLQILNRRFANIHVRICPVAVQGDRAAAEIAAGIAFLNRTHACDVIVVTRGGGSIEDLWPFNEEIVARAVAASEIPVISAVGHERDFSICDFAADLRVPTPSAAAELVIAGKRELTERLEALRQRLAGALRLQLSERRRRCERAAGSPVFREPAALVRMYAQRLDELCLRLTNAMSQRLEQGRARLQQATSTCNALDPRRVLERGYAILRDRSTGRIVRAAGDTRLGGCLHGILARGGLALTVTGVTPETDVTDDNNMSNPAETGG